MEGKRMGKHSYEDAITCPWCDYVFEDSLHEGEAGMVECYSCGKEFEFERDVQVTYSSWKPPILVRKKTQQEKDDDGA
jgi:transcription elongation factor Elf1